MPSPGLAALLASAPERDPYWTSVVSLVSFDGSNGSTSVVDAKGNSWSTFGNAALSTTDSKFGSASLLLDGTGDYVQSAIVAAIGAGDFTVEFWFWYASSPGAAQELLCIVTPESTNADLIIELTAANQVRVSIRNNGASNGLDASTSNSPTAGAWNHFSLSVVGADVRGRVNGVPGLSGTLTGTRGNTLSTVRLGRLASGTPRDFNGRLDELRITKGVGRYPGSGNYSVAVSPWPRR